MLTAPENRSVRMGYAHTSLPHSAVAPLPDKNKGDPIRCKERSDVGK